MNWKITVLTSVPNAPKGKVFPGFNNKLFQTEKIDDIVVYRIWTFIAANAGFYLRILDFLSFLFMAIIASFFIKKHEIFDHFQSPKICLDAFYRFFTIFCQNISKLKSFSLKNHGFLLFFAKICAFLVLFDGFPREYDRSQKSPVLDKIIIF